MATLPTDIRERLSRLNERERQRALMMHARRRLGPERSILDVIQLSEGDVQRLSDKLSDEVRQTLDAVRADQDRNELLKRWVAAALFSRMMPPVNNEQLKPFYDSLAPALKEHLENLPRERMMNELRRMYLKQRFEEKGRPPFRMRGREGRPRGRP